MALPGTLASNWLNDLAAAHPLMLRFTGLLRQLSESFADRERRVRRFILKYIL